MIGIPHIVLPLCLFLGGCAILKKGSHTLFLVQTNPVGANVTTDKDIPKNFAHRAKDKSSKPEYYGCTPTPCSIKLPRRTDFNVLITLQGHSPSTHVVIKNRSEKMVKDANKMAKMGVAGSSAALVSASAIEYGAATLATSPFLIIASTGAIASVPVIGAGTGIDFVTGALIDLTPNPLIVHMTKETSGKDSQNIIAAFHRSRDLKASAKTQKTSN